MYKILLCAFFCFYTFFSFSQRNELKYEKEERIKISQVPEKAKDFIRVLGINTKIKWYKEFNLQQSSIEAKTKFEGQKFSIEFSSEGKIEDIEIIIQSDDIPAPTWQNIRSFLNKDFEKYKLCKAQIQYTGTEDELRKLLQKDFVWPSSQIKYELIFQVKQSRKKQLLEFLFDASGEVLEQKQIIFRNTDNLEY